MTLPLYQYTSPEEYLLSEAKAEHKHEYYNGEMVAMAGAGKEHNYIVANLLREIGGHLKGKTYDVFPSDLRVGTPFSDGFMYPDVSIVCGEPIMKENAFDTLANLTVIIEVMSPSTENSDRGHKFFRYLQIPTLREYLLISSTDYATEAIRVQADGSFKITKCNGKDSLIEIESVGLSLQLADVYYKVEF